MGRFHRHDDGTTHTLEHAESSHDHGDHPARQRRTGAGMQEWFGWLRRFVDGAPT